MICNNCISVGQHGLAFFSSDKKVFDNYYGKLGKIIFSRKSGKARI